MSFAQGAEWAWHTRQRADGMAGEAQECGSDVAKSAGEVEGLIGQTAKGSDVVIIDQLASAATLSNRLADEWGELSQVMNRLSNAMADLGGY